jgi:UDP-glucose 4-epimerase
MRILITGGLGFIGSHLAARLLDAENEVVIIDNESTGLLSNLSNVASDERLTIHKHSILDEGFLDLVASECDYVFHLAAAVGVFNIVSKPIASMMTNIQGTENVLKVALKYNLPVFLTSSSEVYGKNTSDSLKETDDRVIGSPSILRWSYSEAKAIDESLAYAYFIEHQLKTRIVRFFNTVGPRQLGSYGMVVPRFIKSALEDAPIGIYGDGTQTRCFAHVLDVVDAVMLVAFSPDTLGKTINIGNNQEISMNDLAQKIIEMTNSNSKIVYSPYAEVYGKDFEDMARRVPNLDLIHSLVGWQPTRNLDTIILDIVQDLKSNATKS